MAKVHNDDPISPWNEVNSGKDRSLPLTFHVLLPILPPLNRARYWNAGECVHCLDLS